MSNAIIFIDGPDLSGKDTFINKLHSYLPFSVIHYPPGENYFSFPENVRPHSWKISYLTILRSIQKSKNFMGVHFVYRSPFTDYVYNSVFNRESPYSFDDYLKFIEQFGIFELVFLLPPPYLLWERYLSRGDDNFSFDFSTLNLITVHYSKLAKNLKKHFNVSIVESADEYFDSIREIVRKNIPKEISKLTLVDIDGTAEFVKCSDCIYFTGRTGGPFEYTPVIFNNSIIKSSRVFKSIALSFIIEEYSPQSIVIFDDRIDIIDLLFTVLTCYQYTVVVERGMVYKLIAMKR